MKKFLVLFLALVPASAFAAGVDLSWNDCLGGGATSQSKTFVCTGTANQTYNLELQLKSPVAIPAFVSLSSYLDLGPTGANENVPLAPFWHYETGGCNGGTFKGATLSPIPAATAVECPNLAENWDLDDDGLAEGFHSVAAYGADYGRPGNGHFVLLSARGDATPIAPGVNYFGHELRLTNRNRPGSPANCAGCDQAAAIVYNVARLESNDGSPAVDLSGADKFADCALINGATPADCGIVPAQNMTWGKVKSLFR